MIDSIRQPKYLFIDGGQIRDHFVKGLIEWDDSVTHMDIDFSELIRSTGAVKSFYYDCQDQQQLPDEYFSEIRKVSGSHVRRGTLKGRSNKREPRQKEVDILLAVDMMNHSMRRNMKEAVLLTGDMGFLPAVEALIEMGCFVTVMADKNHIANELKDAADEFKEITFKDYYSWSSSRVKSKGRLPEVQFPQLTPLDQGYSLLKQGHCNGIAIELYHRAASGNSLPTFYTYQKDYSPYSTKAGLNYHYHDLERLELFFKLQYGGIEW